MANQGIDPLNPLQEIDPFSTTDEKRIAILKSLCNPCANSGTCNKEMCARFPRFEPLGGGGQWWREPSDLPPCFRMSRPKTSTLLRQTRLGYWKEKEFRSIRVHQRHGGVKRTLEFHQYDDTKTVWHMQEYFLLDPYKTSHDLHLNEEMVLCMVFQKNKDRVPLSLRNLDRSLNGDDDDEESCCDALSPRREVELNRMITSFSECLQPGDGFDANNEVATGDHQMRSTKRVRSIAPHGKSDVWQHFTKIHTDDSDVLYAACHHCDIVLKAHSKNGTSTLRRHSTKCSCKPPEANLS